MRNSVLKKLFGGLFLTGGVVILIFFVFSVLPSNPARIILGQRADSSSLTIINHQLALDQPVYKRFLIYLNDLSPISIYNRKVKWSLIYLDPAKYKNAFKMFYFNVDKTVVFKTPYLQQSYQTKENVADLIREKFYDSAMLVVSTILFALIFGILLGITAALKKQTLVDNIISNFSLILFSLPSFFIAIITGWIFGFILHKYTSLSMTGSLFSIDPFEGEYLNLKNLILPTIVLSLRPMAFIIQFTRSSLLDVLSKNYIRTAKAKGVRKILIVYNHALLNALGPLAHSAHLWLGSVLAGTVFVEYVFGWNGIGKLAISAIQNSDLPLLMGITLFISVAYIILNILAEILYSTLDPRVDADEIKK